MEPTPRTTRPAAPITETDAPAEQSAHQSELVGQIMQQLHDLFDQILRYLRLRADAARETARKEIEEVIFELSIILTAIGLIIAALTLSFIGVAGGISRFFDAEPWVGQIASGLLLAGLVATGLYIRTHRRQRQRLNRLQEKYHETDSPTQN